MTDDQLIARIIETLKSDGLIDVHAKYQVISKVNNLVVKIGDKYLKIYTNRGSTQKDNELSIYKKLRNNRLFKEVLAQGTLANYDYALFREIRGKDFEHEMFSEQHATTIAQAVYDFINEIAKIKITNCGLINNDRFIGSHHTIKDFLLDFYGQVGTVLDHHPATKKYSQLPANLVNKNALKLNRSPLLVPVDLNSRNIMITDDDSVKIVDPGLVAATIPEMAYGNFRANTRGTPTYREFEKLIKTADQQLVKDFSSLHLLNILSYVVHYQTGDPLTTKPYGHQQTIIDLLEANLTDDKVV